MIKFRRITSMLCMVVMLMSFVACGGQNNNNSQGTSEKNTRTDVTDVGENTKEAKAKSDNDSNQKKKIMIVQVNKLNFVLDGIKNIKETLYNGGYNSDTADIIEILTGDMEDVKKEKNYISFDQVVDKAKEIKPDVVLLMLSNLQWGDMVSKLQEIDTSIFVSFSAENYVNKDGKANKNVSGVYMLSNELQVNAFKLLNSVYPANGKKAVMLQGMPGFTEENIRENLKQVGVELKELKTVEYTEEMVEALESYNDDDEVAWSLLGFLSVTGKDGKQITWEEALAKNRDAMKKPDVTYWEEVVKVGQAVLGLSTDLATNGEQIAEMAIEILEGKNISELVAQSPRKTYVVVNLKRAEHLGIEIPVDILSGAKTIYTDYEGSTATK